MVTSLLSSILDCCACSCNDIVVVVGGVVVFCAFRRVIIDDDDDICAEKNDTGRYCRRCCCTGMNALLHLSNNMKNIVIENVFLVVAFQKSRDNVEYVISK